MNEKQEKRKMQNRVHMLHNDCGGSSAAQMNSFIIETEVGELMVMDGGYRENFSYLYEQLRRISGKKKPTVAGWFLSHAHDDHIDCFLEMMEKYPDSIEIQHIYYNFPSRQFIAKNEASGVKSIQEFYRLLPKFADKAVIVTEGDYYELGGAVFEILYSPNPAWSHNPVNNSSIVIRMTLGGKTFLFLGDLGVEAGEQILAKYGAYLKSDYCQMAHHGQDGVGKEVYQAIAPYACIWNTPLWLWNNDLGGGFDTNVFKTVIVRKWMEELGVKKHYIMKDGDQTIAVHNHL